MAVLRYNSQSLQLTHLKNTIQCFLVSSQGVQPSPLYFQSIFITLEKNSIPINPHYICLSSPTPGNYSSTFFLYRVPYLGHFV